jgi:hypothetical protein
MTDLLKNSIIPLSWDYSEFMASPFMWVHVIIFLIALSIALTLGVYLLKRKIIPYRMILCLVAVYTLFHALDHLIELVFFSQQPHDLLVLSETGILFISFAMFGIFVKQMYKNKLFMSLTPHNHYIWLVESTDDAIISVDIQGRCLSWNKGAERLYGYKAEEILGRTTEMLIPDNQDPIEIRERIQGMFRGETKNPYEGIRRHKSGKLVNVLVTYTRITNDRGKVLGGVTIAKNLTEKKNLERLLAEKAAQLEETNAALKKANRSLKIKNEALNYFAYAASHDLKSPLRIINNFSYLLLENFSATLTEQAKEHLSMISNQSRRMGMLIDDLLAYVQTGSEEYPQEDVDLNKVLQDVLYLLDKPTTFEIKIPEKLPTIISPKIPLQQVIYNLINNSIKHHHHPDKGWVKITANLKKHSVIIKVEDNGPGIHENYHKKIFDLFQTLQPKKTLSGNGVGLTLVKKIILKYKGKIKVFSGVGQGTLFEITWPLKHTSSSRAILSNKQRKRLKKPVQETKVATL